MTIKELKTRFIKGLMYRPLFLLPTPVKEVKRGTLTIYLCRYRYYDIETNEYVRDYLQYNVYGAIAIKNSSGQIVYNSRKSIGDRVDGNDDRRYFTIANLPYGEYKIKVIRSIFAEPDKEWHNITVNAANVNANIILDWQMDGVFLQDFIYDLNYEGKYVLIDPSKYVKYLKFSGDEYGTFDLYTNYKEEGRTIIKIYQGFDRKNEIGWAPSKQYGSLPFIGSVKRLNNVILLDNISGGLESTNTGHYEYTNDSLVKLGETTITEHDIGKGYVDTPTTETEPYLTGYEHYYTGTDAKVYYRVNSSTSLNYTPIEAFRSRCGLYSLTDIDWVMYKTHDTEGIYSKGELSINGHTSGHCQTNYLEGSKKDNYLTQKIWYDPVGDRNYGTYYYTYDSVGLFDKNTLIKYIENSQKYPDFVDGFDVGIILFVSFDNTEPNVYGKQYYTKEEYTNALNTIPSDQIMYNTIVKDYSCGNYIENFLKTDIAKEFIEPNSDFRINEIGIRYKGLYWASNYPRHVHADIQPAMVTTYEMHTRMKYSDDYHDYDPT